MLKTALILAGLSGFVTSVFAQGDSPLDVAKEIDAKSRLLKNAQEDVRRRGIRNLILQIRQQPPKYAVTLAQNLVIDQADGSDRETLQALADNLADALSKAAEQQRTPNAFRKLAELARYDQVSVSSDVPQYLAAMRELDGEDQWRRNANFTLTDLDGKKWVLQELRGKVVIVNFWATWCPPCRKELPTLKLIYDRFKDRGLLILAISGEQPSTVRKFAVQNNITFPVLLDGGKKVEEEAFHVSGFPVNFIFDRSGRLVAQTSYALASDRLLEKLERAGLH